MTMAMDDRVMDEALPPIVPYIGRGSDGRPCLVGSRCVDCGEILPGAPAVCPACGSRAAMTPLELARTGRLYNYTIVHRCLPGVPVPFIFAIVDLDDGACIKGNLVGNETDVAFDMPVRVEFARTERTDAAGRAYLSYHFVKA